MTEDTESPLVSDQAQELRADESKQRQLWKKMPRRTFLLMAASFLLSSQAKKDYGEADGRDPDIRRVLEREDIDNVNLRMFFGDHILGDETYQRFKDIGTNVITGEINIDWDFHLQEPSEDDAWDNKIFKDQGFLKHLIQNMTENKTGLTGTFSDAYFHSFQNWRRAYHEE